MEHEFLGERRDEKAFKKAREKCRVRLHQLVKTGKLLLLGTVQLKEWGGKPELTFATPAFKIKRDWLKHDVMMWLWLRTIPNATFMTGFEADLWADAEVTFSNKLEAMIEMDTETESLATVVKRWDELAASTKKVLFITTSQGRIKKLKDRAQKHEIGNRIFFAFWFDLIEGKEYRWEDCKGHLGVLYPVGG